MFAVIFCQENTVIRSRTGSFGNNDGKEKRLNQFEIVQLVGATESC